MTWSWSDFWSYEISQGPDVSVKKFLELIRVCVCQIHHLWPHCCQCWVMKEILRLRNLEVQEEWGTLMFFMTKPGTQGLKLRSLPLRWTVAVFCSTCVVTKQVAAKAIAEVVDSAAWAVLVYQFIVRFWKSWSGRISGPARGCGTWYVVTFAWILFDLGEQLAILGPERGRRGAACDLVLPDWRPYSMGSMGSMVVWCYSDHIGWLNDNTPNIYIYVYIYIYTYVYIVHILVIPCVLRQLQDLSSNKHFAKIVWNMWKFDFDSYTCVTRIYDSSLIDLPPLDHRVSSPTSLFGVGCIMTIWPLFCSLKAHIDFARNLLLSLQELKVMSSVEEKSPGTTPRCVSWRYGLWPTSCSYFWNSKDQQLNKKETRPRILRNVDETHLQVQISDRIPDLVYRIRYLHRCIDMFGDTKEIMSPSRAQNCNRRRRTGLPRRAIHPRHPREV